MLRAICKRQNGPSEDVVNILALRYSACRELYLPGLRLEEMTFKDFLALKCYIGYMYVKSEAVLWKSSQI